ncbi:MAG: Bug family tripartite tricarboxylate transporter substrate binding protein [Burkholderiales bacterium]
MQRYCRPVSSLIVAVATTGIVAISGVAHAQPHAQPFPTKPIRLIVSFAPGGTTDIVARILGQALTERLGQQIVIDNRGGAGGTIGTELVARSAPDGYTLVTCGINNHGMGPAIQKHLPYDPIRDFAPISLMYTVPNVLVVHPSVPVKSVPEFIAYAKKNPGKLSYGSSGPGSSPHLSMEWLRAITGIDVVHVPYKGGGPAVTDLLGGQIQAMFNNVSTQQATIKAGRVRALGVTSAKRTPQLPDVPTFIEAGVPGFEVTAWQGICAPSGISKTVQTRLNVEVVAALNSPDLQRRLAEQGVDPAPNTPADFAVFIRNEIAKWAKVVKSAGVEPQ